MWVVVIVMIFYFIIIIIIKFDGSLFFVLFKRKEVNASEVLDFFLSLGFDVSAHFKLS